MDRRFIFLVFSVSIIAGAYVGVGDISSLDRSIGNDPYQQEAGIEIVQCTNESYSCEKSYIESRRVSCDPWQPWYEYGRLDCERSEEVGSISLVADPANYIDLDRTNASYSVERVAYTGPEPWDLAFLPEGGMIWTLREGKVFVERSSGTKQYDVSSLKYGEAGLMGVAVDPDFEENRFVYLYYTENKTSQESNFTGNPILQNRISRFQLTDKGLKDEEVLQKVPGSKYHSGGRLEFGPDGKLYATTGDADNPLAAFNNKSFLGGKILRMNTDGSVPEDNPFEDSLVYSMGHRNPQGIAWNPENNQLYSSEHGSWRDDELNRVDPGKNYGWGNYECDSTNPLLESRNIEPFDYRPPVRCFENWTMAPSGMAFVDDAGHPWYGDLFLAGLRGKHIYRAEVEDGEIAKEEIFYISKDEGGLSLRLRDVSYYNGSLYVLGDKRGLYRIEPVDKH